MSPNSCTAGWWILIAATSQQATTTRDLNVPGLQRLFGLFSSALGRPEFPADSIPFRCGNLWTPSLLLCFDAGCISVSLNLAGATVTVTLRQINPNQSRKNPSTCTLPQTKSSSRLSQLKTWKRLRDMQVWFTDIRLDSPQRLWAPRSIVRQPSSTTSFKTSSAGEHCRLRQTGMANP